LYYAFRSLNLEEEEPPAALRRKHVGNTPQREDESFAKASKLEINGNQGKTENVISFLSTPRKRVTQTRPSAAQDQK